MADDKPMDEQFNWLLDQIKSKNVAMVSMGQENAILRGALMVISEWRLPHKGFSWENGSNGERDHFRQVARNALELTHG